MLLVETYMIKSKKYIKSSNITNKKTQILVQQIYLRRRHNRYSRKSGQNLGINIIDNMEKVNKP